MTASTRTSTSTGRGVALSVLAAGVVSALVNTVISVAAQALGADATLAVGLTPGAYILFGVVGLLIGALVWAMIRSRAADPAGLLRRLVPAVVVLSLIPDALIGLAGFGWTAAVALGLMHLVVAAAGVSAFHRLLPLR